jgi:hypothetical protein
MRRSYAAIRDRIPFSSAIAKVSTVAIRHDPSIFPVTAALAFVHVIWTIIWLVCAMGSTLVKDKMVSAIYPLTNNCRVLKRRQNILLFFKRSIIIKQFHVYEGHTHQPGVAALALYRSVAIGSTKLLVYLFCFLWTSLVIKNILFCATSGSVAKWWYEGEQH